MHKNAPHVDSVSKKKSRKSTLFLRIFLSGSGRRFSRIQVKIHNSKTMNVCFWTLMFGDAGFLRFRAKLKCSSNAYKYFVILNPGM